MPLTCNIDSRGKRARLIYGMLMIALGVVLRCSSGRGRRTRFGSGRCRSHAWRAAAFAVFEARAGWCVVRAMGFQDADVTDAVSRLWRRGQLQFGIPEFHHAPIQPILHRHRREARALHFLANLLDAVDPYARGRPTRAGVAVDEHVSFVLVLRSRV